MKKIIVLIALMFFVQFILFRGLFTACDSFTPSNTSGNIMLTALALIFTILSCCILFIILLIEKFKKINLKDLTLLILFLHCFLLFYWEAFVEYDLFNDSKSFTVQSIFTIIIYFIFELFLSFYLVNRLYKFNLPKDGSR